MAELNVQEVKKDLDGLMSKAKTDLEKSKLSQMSDAEKKALEAEKKKVDELRIQKETEAKKEAELLTKKEEELLPEEKTKRQELLDKKHKEEESKLSADEKIKRVKEESQKRIDELANELKQLKDKTPAEIDSLKKEMELIRQEKDRLEKIVSTKPAEDDIQTLIEKEEQKKVNKYLEEDKELPREKRREMSKEELNDWLLEDMGEAIQWINKNTLRRTQEKYQATNKLTYERRLKEIVEKQAESSKRVELRHPELNVTKREEELKAQGKTKEEIYKVLCDENPKWKLAADIVRENPDRFLGRPDSPELVAAELEKRLANQSKSNNTDNTLVEKLQKQIEEMSAEIERMKNADVGIGGGHRRGSESSGKLSEAEENLVKTMKDMNLSQAMIDSALKRFRERKENA